MYQVTKSLVKRFAGEKDGATMLEYGLLVGLVAVVSITVVTTLGTEIRDAFQAVVNALTA